MRYILKALGLVYIKDVCQMLDNESEKFNFFTQQVQDLKCNFYIPYKEYKQKIKKP